MQLADTLLHFPDNVASTEGLNESTAQAMNHFWYP